MSRDRREGFVLITVLWVVAALGAVAAEVGGDVALDVRASTNRAIAERAYWRARGCATAARSMIERRLSRTSDAIALARAWDELDRDFAALDPRIAGCAVALEASGSRLALNRSSEAQLRRLVVAAGFAGAPDAVVNAILVRRDATPFVDAGELRTILGNDAYTMLEPLVTADSGVIALNHAPREVILALGALPVEVVDRLIRRRAVGIVVHEHHELADGVSVQSADRVREQMPMLLAFTTLEPTSWILRVRVAGGHEAAAFTLEERVVRIGRMTESLEVRFP